LLIFGHYLYLSKYKCTTEKLFMPWHFSLLEKISTAFTKCVSFHRTFCVSDIAKYDLSLIHSFCWGMFFFSRRCNTIERAIKDLRMPILSFYFFPMLRQNLERYIPFYPTLLRRWINSISIFQTTEDHLYNFYPEGNMSCANTCVNSAVGEGVINTSTFARLKKINCASRTVWI